MGPLETGSTSTAFEQALGEKACGNTHFAAGDYARARDSYDLALSFLRDGFVATKEANELAAKVHTNAAAACIKLGDPLSAIEHCQLAIAIDPRNVKALFRKAESLKSLGRYSEALAQLERALLLEENNEEIKESMDECEDLIEFQDHRGAFGSRHDFDPPGVDADKEEQQLPEEALAAAHAKLEELTEEILGGSATVEEHVMLNHGEAKFGKFDIKDAFFSPSNLSSALEFVRGQHFTASAKFAFVVVQKSRMNYPNVWWAHPWPVEDREMDGVFLETHARGAHSTWFIPLEGSAERPIPQRALLLDQECKLLDEPLFP